MQFTNQHLKAFESLSYDKSPIHWDQAYARRTPFASVVVYGIAAVLYGLGLWSKGRSFSIITIKGNFNRTLYENIDYEYVFKEKGNKVRVAIVHNMSELMDFTFEWEEWSADNSIINNSSIFKFNPKTCANISAELPGNVIDVCYKMNENEADGLKEYFLLNISQLPLQQLTTLLWSSYHVGMVWPGQQALYLDFKIKFNHNKKNCNNEQVTFDKLFYKLDDRFKLTTIKGQADDVDIKISAFVRPKPVSYSLEAIKCKIKVDNSLNGKTVLVLGASRGFGSVLARAFLLKGASVIFNYRTSDKALKSLQEELTFYKDKTWFYQGDMANNSVCANLKDELTKKGIKVDFLICSASPPIQTAPFDEQNTEKFLQFVNASVAVVHNPIFMLLPALCENAYIINISSIYAAQPPKHFTHYVTAKWAIEGMTHALASEYPTMNFVLARLPRILTDQTNVNFDFEKKLSAIDITSELFLRLFTDKIQNNPLLVDF